MRQLQTGGSAEDKPYLAQHEPDTDNRGVVADLIVARQMPLSRDQRIRGAVTTDWVRVVGQMKSGVQRYMLPKGRKERKETRKSCLPLGAVMNSAKLVGTKDRQNRTGFADIGDR